MFVIQRSFFVLLLITTFLIKGRAEPHDLKPLPSSEAERGDAFIEAWIVLRKNLDSLSHLEVHPALLDHWFEAMPAFLARDVARLATDPVVVQAAASRLRSIGGMAYNSKTTHQKKRKALSRAFPYHYKMFLRKERAIAPLDVENSMYDTWIRVMGDAVERGAHTTADVITDIETKMRNPKDLGDTEIARRHLHALKDFWLHVDTRISNTGSLPSWPTNFALAMTALRFPKKASDLSPKAEGKRVEAAIALCSSLGKNLGYDKTNFETEDLSILTAGAGRAFDGNFATSWYVARGKTLTLLNKSNRALTGLWIANSCPGQKDSRILSLRITGRNDGSSWTKKASLKLDTDYFQFIELKSKRAKRLEIRIDEIEGLPRSCISEIRLDTQ